jgi:hypothetical protein
MLGPVAFVGNQIMKTEPSVLGIMSPRLNGWGL